MAADPPILLGSDLLARWKAPAKTLARRRGSISAYVGSNGGGKTLCAVQSLLPSLQAGRPVYSTVPLLDPGTGEPHPAYTPLVKWAQLLDIHGADVLLDEVATVASARQSQSLPHALEVFFQQLRKRDCRLLWTAPDWRRPDVVLRKVTLTVTYCRGFMPKDNGSGWPDRRLFRWSTYSAAEFEDFTIGARERTGPLTSEWHWRPRGLAHRAYDTLAGVSIIEDDVSDTGTCGHCGGARTRPRCSCERPQGRQARGRTQRDAAPVEPHQVLALLTADSDS